MEYLNRKAPEPVELGKKMVKGPYQDKEGKEETESMKAEDDVTGPPLCVTRPQTELVMEGKPISAADEFDNDVAGQHGSATKRIESLAGGNQNKLVMDGKPFPAEDELDNDMAGQRGSEAKRIESLAGGNQNKLVMDGKPFSAADELDNVVPGQRGPETERMESSAGGDSSCSPNTVASWMGKELPTANHEGVCHLPHQRRTRETESRKSAFEYLCNIFGTRSAAAVWIMMALTVGTSSLTGAVCIGTEVKVDKGEAVLRCPLPVDVSDTGQGIIIKHFPETGSDPETVMYCFGPTKEADQPKCYSSDGFSLVGHLTDQVVAKVPVSRLMDNGDYKCQLHPLGDHHYFIPCHVHHFSVNETADDMPVTQEDQHSADTYTPVVSSTTKGRKPGKDPPNREAPPCVGQSSSVGLTAAVLVLQIIIIILLLVNFFCLQNRNDLRAAGQRTALSPVVV